MIPAADGLSVTKADRFRCAVFHAHADLRMAIKMLRRLRFFAAWQRARQGYDRLGKVLENRNP